MGGFFDIAGLFLPLSTAFAAQNEVEDEHHDGTDDGQNEIKRFFAVVDLVLPDIYHSCWASRLTDGTLANANSKPERAAQRYRAVAIRFRPVSIDRTILCYEKSRDTHEYYTI